MNIHKKALSLLLSITLVVSTFGGTMAFAEEKSTWDSQFDSGVADSAITYHITDSNFDPANGKDSGAVEVQQVHSSTDQVIIPNRVVDSNDDEFKDSNFNVTAIAENAFTGVKAHHIEAHISDVDLEVNVETYDTQDTPNSDKFGGYVELYKDSNNSNYLVTAYPENGYEFYGWTQNGTNVPEDEWELNENGVPTFESNGGTVTAKFKAQATQPFNVTIGKLDVVNQEDGNTIASQANQDAVTVSQDNSTITVSGILAKLNSFDSTNPEQGNHKWIGLVVNTGEDSIIGISYNGTALTQADVDDASSVGVKAGSFILWIKADEIVSTPKTFTLSKDGKTDTIIAINFTDNTPAAYTITFDPNGGNVSVTNAQTNSDNKLASLPIPTRTNYRFDGWFTAASEGTQVTTETIFNADSTVYAHWTYTGSSGGGGNHHSGGNGSGSGTTIPPTPTPSQDTFTSDTTTDFTINENYQFKISSKNGMVPNLVVGTAGVFNTQLISTSGNDYFFKLIAIGKPGDKAGIYVNGIKLLVATVGSTNSAVKSDTTGTINVKLNKTYQFRLTADTKPNFVAGSRSFKVDFVKTIGKDYFYKITAIGTIGDKCGFYISSSKNPIAIATIS